MITDGGLHRRGFCYYQLCAVTICCHLLFSAISFCDLLLSAIICYYLLVSTIICYYLLRDWLNCSLNPDSFTFASSAFFKLLDFSPACWLWAAISVNRRSLSSHLRMSSCIATVERFWGGGGWRREEVDRGVRRTDAARVRLWTETKGSGLVSLG